MKYTEISRGFVTKNENLVGDLLHFLIFYIRFTTISFYVFFMSSLYRQTVIIYKYVSNTTRVFASLIPA